MKYVADRMEDQLQVLPRALRLQIALPFNKYPFCASGPLNAELNSFRSADLIDGHTYGLHEKQRGTIGHYHYIGDLFATELTNYLERVRVATDKHMRLQADVQAVRRLFDWRQIDAQG